LELLGWIAATKIDICTLSASRIPEIHTGPIRGIPDPQRSAQEDPGGIAVSRTALEVKTPRALPTLRWPKPGEKWSTNTGHPKTLLQN